MAIRLNWDKLSHEQIFDSRKKIKKFQYLCDDAHDDKDDNAE